MRLTVMFEVALPFHVKREGKRHVASCRLLDVHSQGPSRQKAVQNLIEAIQLFLLSCFERGVLEQVLKDCGFRPVSSRSMRARAARPRAPREYELVKVPLPFLAERRRSDLCPV